MIRYFVVATGIVVAFILALLAIGRLQRADSAPTPYASTVAAPGSPRAEADPSTTALPITGEAPWALSALPGCFHETRHAKRLRSERFIYPEEPRDWRIIDRGVLVTADCRLTVDSVRHTVDVARGDTRLHISHATVFVGGLQMMLMRHVNPSGFTDIRVYALRDGTVPQFEER